MGNLLYFFAQTFSIGTYAELIKRWLGHEVMPFFDHLRLFNGSTPHLSTLKYIQVIFWLLGSF